MADGQSTTDLVRLLRHETRSKIVGLVWHRGEPPSPLDLDADIPEATLATISYHVGVLERGGVIEVARSGEAGERRYVVAGPGAGDAVRLLGLT